MAKPKTKEEIATDKAAADKVVADKAAADAEKAEKPPKKKTMVIAAKCTCTNPYTKDVFTKGVARDTPKKKDSWYKCQVEAGYLKEVKV